MIKSIIFGLIFFSFQSHYETHYSEPSIIPFRLVKDQILVEVFIDGQGPYNMLFDTGVTPSSINLEVANALELPLDSLNDGTVGGRGTGRIMFFPTKIENLQLGNYYVSSLKAVATNNKLLGKALGTTLHGILGYSLLKDKIFKIDYENQKIQFFESRGALDETLQGKHVVLEKFIFQEGDIIPILENLKINDKPFIASLDSGSSLEIEIFSHHIKKFQIEPDSLNTYQITGARGKDENIKVTIDRFSLAETHFHNIEGGVANVKNTTQLRQGNIGNKFLKRYKVSFDYKNKEVIFEKD